MKKKRISDKAVDYILACENQELKNLSVLDIARHIGANRSYLSRVFKIDQNITISQFVQREKIHRAIFTLEMNSDKKITEISKELGFREFQKFVNKFTNYLAIDPERYRYLKKKKESLQDNR